MTDKNIDDVLKIPITIPAHAVKHTGTDYIWELPDSMKAPIKAALLKLLLESLPEKSMDIWTHKDGRNQINDDRTGYNRAIEEFTKNLKDKFQ